jgi:signal peptidase II
MASRRAVKLYPFLVLTICLLALDQLTKVWALETLTPYQSVPFIGELLKLNLVWNEAAAFSIGFGATWIFTIISSLAALVIFVLILRTKVVVWRLTLSVLLGGVLGNLGDRLFREPGFAVGKVVDFFQLPFGFPVFNVADICISGAMTVVVILIMRGKKLLG